MRSPHAPPLTCAGEARTARINDIEVFDNLLRRHSAVGDHSPVVSEEETVSEASIMNLLSQVP